MKIKSQYLFIGAAVLSIGFLLYFFADIVSWVAISWVLSLLGQPFMRWYQRIKVGRFKVGSSLAAAMTLMTFLLIISILSAILLPMVIRQAQFLAEVENIAVVESLEEPLTYLQDRLVRSGLMREDGRTLIDYIQNSFIGGYEPSDITKIFTSLIGFTGSLFISVFSIIFITFFLLREKGLIANMLMSITPKGYRRDLARAMDQITQLLTRYFAGVLLQITIITTYVSFFLGLLSIESALLIGFFAAFINVVPYLGPFIGAILGMIITISSNLDADFYTETWPLLVRVGFVFLTVQMLDNFILQPGIFSKSVKAHPLEIFLIIMVAAKLGGIIGMILAIPVYTMIRVMATIFFKEFDLVKKISARINDDNSPKAPNKSKTLQD
ncbi:MAG: AI-2E family transporter [Bacteroidota bacterium]